MFPWLLLLLFQWFYYYCIFLFVLDPFFFLSTVYMWGIPKVHGLTWKERPHRHETLSVHQDTLLDVWHWKWCMHDINFSFAPCKQLAPPSPHGWIENGESGRRLGEFHQQSKWWRQSFGIQHPQKTVTITLSADGTLWIFFFKFHVSVVTPSMLGHELFGTPLVYTVYNSAVIAFNRGTGTVAFWDCDYRTCVACWVYPPHRGKTVWIPVTTGKSRGLWEK